MLWSKIQTQLDKNDMSVYQLSKLSGIPSNTLYQYKNNGVQPTFKMMCRIADVFDVSLDIFREGGKLNDN